MKDKLQVRVTAEKIHKRNVKIRLIFMLISILMLLITTIYGVIYIVSGAGNFTITLDSSLMSRTRIVMSPYRDFSETGITLHADALDYMDNISGDWLPDDIHLQEGDHSQDDYIAYSFFLKNEGDEAVDYNAVIAIQSVIKNVDEAVRVRVYHNKESTTYAKPSPITGLPEPNTTPFVSNTRIMDMDREEFEPGDVDKFTVVIWLEGDDPECVDDILGGEMKMLMYIRRK